MFKPLLVAVVALPLLLAARVLEPAYQAANSRISADYRAAKAACASLAGQPREVCYEQSQARRKEARAELEEGSGGLASEPKRVRTLVETDEPVAVPVNAMAL
jgi:hypothetical protein